MGNHHGCTYAWGGVALYAYIDFSVPSSCGGAVREHNRTSTAVFKQAVVLLFVIACGIVTLIKCLIPAALVMDKVSVVLLRLSVNKFGGSLPVATIYATVPPMSLSGL